MAKRKVWTQAATPVNGTSGSYANLTEPGDLLVSTDDDVVYMNTNTKGSPTWTAVGTAVGAGDIAEAEIEAASLSGTVVKVGGNDNVVGAIPVLHRIVIAAGALAAKNVTLTHKTRVVDAWVVLTGAGVANTVLVVGNGATAITDAMDVSGSDKAVIRAATIDDASHEIAAAGSLRVTTSVGATQPACIVYVLGERVA